MILPQLMIAKICRPLCINPIPPVTHLLQQSHTPSSFQIVPFPDDSALTYVSLRVFIILTQIATLVSGYFCKESAHTQASYTLIHLAFLFH